MIGTLTSAGGQVLRLDQNDALWLARAIMGEGPRDAQHVSSTMLRRWAYVSDARGRPGWASLAELLTGDRDGDGSYDRGEAGYSQPVAVQWQARGDAAKQRRRLRTRSLSWEQIDEAVRATVMAILGGRMALSMAGAVHFADAPTSAAFLARTPGSWRVGSGANHFLGVRGSRGYRDPTILGADGGSAPPRSHGATLAGAAVVALVLL